jgi:hypothetical protein
MFFFLPPFWDWIVCLLLWCSLSFAVIVGGGKLWWYHPYIVGRESVVGIATGYGLDGPVIESRWGRDFPHPSRTARWAPPSSYTIPIGPFPSLKLPGRVCWPPTPTSHDVKVRVYLYLYHPSGCSWLAVVWSFTLLYSDVVSTRSSQLQNQQPHSDTTQNAR